MKINISIFVCTYVILIVSDLSSSFQIRECYACTGKENECEPTASKCKGTEATTVVATTATSITTTTEPPPAGRLVERDEDATTTEEYTGPTLPQAIPDGRSPVLAFKCLTVTGKQTEDGDVMMFKGCGYSCDIGVDANRTSYSIKETCKSCDDKDLCNSSARIDAIRWTILIVSMIWVGTHYL